MNKLCVYVIIFFIYLGDFLNLKIDKDIIMLKTKYSSPTNIKNPRVFSKKSLIALIQTWNKYKPDKIIYKKTDSIAKLSNALNTKIKPICDDKQYWCWTGALDKIAKDQKTKQIIKMIADHELRPEMPKEWIKNPIEWLSNYDIDDVMMQYSNEKKYKYSFLGVFPIDFSEEDHFGRCLYSHICSLDPKKYINKGIKYLGLITNLDKHDQSGSHWTSTFIILDPKNKSYGAHYYDSTAKPIPAYVKKFINSIKRQLIEIYPNAKFRITYNNRQHQRKNTECGMFSMIFQIRWLNLLLNYKKLKISNPYYDRDIPNIIIKDDKLTDDIMIENRKYLFRPNFDDFINKKNITI